MHGVYKPGNVKLRPKVLKRPRRRSSRSSGSSRQQAFHLVFHGGSGSSAEEIAAAVDYGVVKMNVDTDTQYAFTRPIAGHMFHHYDGVLKVDGEVGHKKQYDPAPGARPARPAWPPGSSRRARTCARPARRWRLSPAAR